MTIIRVKNPNQPPECPLCFKQMREIVTQYGQYYCCLEEFCMISIKKNDPCCGRWREKPENAPTCQFCGKKMRMFFRSDRFMKVQCRDKSHRFYQIVRGNAEYLPTLRD